MSLRAPQTGLWICPGGRERLINSDVFYSRRRLSPGAVGVWDVSASHLYRSNMTVNDSTLQRPLSLDSVDAKDVQSLCGSRDGERLSGIYLGWPSLKAVRLKDNLEIVCTDRQEAPSYKEMTDEMSYPLLIWGGDIFMPSCM